jgi:hypothetical protein
VTASEVVISDQFQRELRSAKFSGRKPLAKDGGLNGGSCVTRFSWAKRADLALLIINRIDPQLVCKVRFPKHDSQRRGNIFPRRSGSQNHIIAQFRVSASRRHRYTPARRFIKSKKTGEFGTLDSAKSAHMRAAAGAGSGNDVHESISVHIAAGYVDSALELRIVGKELVENCSILSAENSHMRAAAGSRPGNDVRETITVHIPAGYVDAS